MITVQFPITVREEIPQKESPLLVTQETSVSSNRHRRSPQKESPILVTQETTVSHNSQRRNPGVSHNGHTRNPSLPYWSHKKLPESPILVTQETPESTTLVTQGSSHVWCWECLDVSKFDKQDKVGHVYTWYNVQVLPLALRLRLL